ncbi:hypothetical protein NR798_11700 [Archangium gephyra]|uniref:DUF6414 family protein n=1 Tax=Archangium gephyra TaxID=48 RepID=UPI0035D4EE51
MDYPLHQNQLAIPIYLNQRIVFDLLAIIEQGFSQLHTIKTTEVGSESNKNDTNAEIGAANVFAFLKLGFNRSRQKEEKQSSQREISEEKVFTPTALFARLRDSLTARGLIKFVDLKNPNTKVELGEFVEFTALLRKNPFADWMDATIQFLDMMRFAESFQFMDTAQNKTKPKNKTSELTKLDESIRKLFSTIIQAKTLDLIASTKDAELRAVIPVEFEYFERQSPAAIIDGQFRVLGKVVHIVEKNGTETINLLRGTTLSRLPTSVLEQMGNAFVEARDSGLKIPELITSIEGPAFQIVPIAIFA